MDTFNMAPNLFSRVYVILVLRRVHPAIYAQLHNKKKQTYNKFNIVNELQPNFQQTSVAYDFELGVKQQYKIHLQTEIFSDLISIHKKEKSTRRHEKRRLKAS